MLVVPIEEFLKLFSAYQLLLAETKLIPANSPIKVSHRRGTVQPADMINSFGVAGAIGSHPGSAIAEGPYPDDTVRHLRIVLRFAIESPVTSF